MFTYASILPGSPKALSLRGPLRDENVRLYTLAQVVFQSDGILTASQQCWFPRCLPSAHDVRFVIGVTRCKLGSGHGLLCISLAVSEVGHRLTGLSSTHFSPSLSKTSAHFFLQLSLIVRILYVLMLSVLCLFCMLHISFIFSICSISVSLTHFPFAPRILASGTCGFSVYPKITGGLQSLSYPWNTFLYYFCITLVYR